MPWWSSGECGGAATCGRPLVASGYDEEESRVVARAFDGLRERQVSGQIRLPTEADSPSNRCGIHRPKCPGHWGNIMVVEPAVVDEGIELGLGEIVAGNRKFRPQFGELQEAAIAAHLRGIEGPPEDATAIAAKFRCQQRCEAILGIG